MQLSQEYFDKGLSNLMEKIETRFVSIESTIATKLATKDDLKQQTKELKQYTHEAFETQQQWMDERFGELITTYDVRDRVGKLEKEVAKLKLQRSAHV